jgi:hypothetical protein
MPLKKTKKQVCCLPLTSDVGDELTEKIKAFYSVNDHSGSTFRHLRHSGGLGMESRVRSSLFILKKAEELY